MSHLDHTNIVGNYWIYLPVGFFCAFAENYKNFFCIAILFI